MNTRYAQWKASKHQKKRTERRREKTGMECAALVSMVVLAMLLAAQAMGLQGLKCDAAPAREPVADVIAREPDPAPTLLDEPAPLHSSLSLTSGLCAPAPVSRGGLRAND